MTDAPLGDHLADPHHHHGAGHQGEGRLDYKHRLRKPLCGVLPQDQGKDQALQDAPAQSYVAGDLGDLAPAGLALILLEVLQLGQGRGKQLDDDRGVDERQDAQSENAEGGQAAPGEDVQEPDQLTALGEELLKGHPVDAWHRDVDAQPDQQQQAEGG